jgi:hypothetical protein|tara:strand:+ start:2517 stop:2939 length:423 start_codon:yes stop_codon:yes gene_type:complete
VEEILPDIPFVGWMAILALAFIFFVVLILQLWAEGKKYGLNFFLSLPFTLMFVSSSAVYYSIYPTMFADEANAAQVWSENVTWGLYAFVGSCIISLLMNIKASNPFFGSLYTLGQALVSSLSAFVLFFIIFRALVLTERD